MESIASHQIFSAWVQTAGLVGAALIATLIYALGSYRATRRVRRAERQFFDRILILAQQTRKLFHQAELACATGEKVPAIWLLSTFESERRCLSQALHVLPLEQAPDAGLFAPVLKLSVCLAEMGEGPLGASRGDARQTFIRLHRRADTAIERIEALRKLHDNKPRLPLRRRSVTGMPTTAVDRYAEFRFMEELYLEPDSVEFEVLVNNQSVRCSIAHEELERLAEAERMVVAADFRRYATIFKRQRELIYLAAESLIRAGARSPVEVRFSDLQAVRKLAPVQANVVETDVAAV